MKFNKKILMISAATLMLVSPVASLANANTISAASVKKAIEKCIAEQMDMLTLDAPAFPGQTNTLGDMQKAGKPMTDDGTEINETKDSLVYALRYLDDREKAVITHFYGINTNETMTMAEIGESLGLKRERVRQIRKTAERKIRKLMKK